MLYCIAWPVWKVASNTMLYHCIAWPVWKVASNTMLYFTKKILIQMKTCAIVCVLLITCHINRWFQCKHPILSDQVIWSNDWDTIAPHTCIIYLCSPKPVWSIWYRTHVGHDHWNYLFHVEKNVRQCGSFKGLWLTLFWVPSIQISVNYDILSGISQCGK